MKTQSFDWGFLLVLGTTLTAILLLDGNFGECVMLGCILLVLVKRVNK